jgi:hypothetical protein
MKETKTKIKIYCSPFLSLNSDWAVLSIPKYANLSFELEWQKTGESADVIIVPSHINTKAHKIFKSFLKSVSSSATLLVYPEPLSGLTDLFDVTSMQLEHSLWMFPSSVLTPEEIIHEFSIQRGV